MQEYKTNNETGIRTPHILLQKKNEDIRSAQSRPQPRAQEMAAVQKPMQKTAKTVHAQRTTALNSAIIYISFLAMLVLVGLLALLLPDKDISTRENRVLAQFPKFSINAIFSGQTSSDLDSWYSDQFPARDGLVTLWKKIDASLSLKFTEDDITIVDGNDDLAQGALNPNNTEDNSNPLYTSPFFGTGEGENPNP